MTFVDPRQMPFVRPRSRGELPHLQKPGGTYFVTIRLADAVIPRTERGVRRMAEDLTAADLVADYDPPLTLGSCILRDDRAASIVRETLKHFAGQRYALAAWCVMPNHVHVIVAPWIGHPLDKILHSWKSFAAHEVNKAVGRNGPLWERESFDHLVRDARSLEGFVRYVEQNPVAAGLVSRPEDWPFSSATA
jgi:REP element-mobilizing transposase RayT